LYHKVWLEHFITSIIPWGKIKTKQRQQNTKIHFIRTNFSTWKGKLKERKQYIRTVVLPVRQEEGGGTDVRLRVDQEEDGGGRMRNRRWLTYLEQRTLSKLHRGSNRERMRRRFHGSRMFSLNDCVEWNKLTHTTQHNNFN